MAASPSGESRWSKWNISQPWMFPFSKISPWLVKYNSWWKELADIQTTYGVSLFSGMSQVTFVMIDRNGNPTFPLTTAGTLPLSLSLSLPHMQTQVTTDPSPYSPMPSSVLCHLPKREGIHPGLIHLGPADPLWWMMILETQSLVGHVCTFVCVCEREQRRNPTLPFDHTSMAPCHAWPSACDQTDRRRRVRWKCLERERERASTHQAFTPPAFSGAPCAAPWLFFLVICFFIGGNLEARQSRKAGTKMPGQFECSVLEALPRIDPWPGIYPCCKYHKAVLVKINRQKCSDIQKRY